MIDPTPLLSPVLRIQSEIRYLVVQACERGDVEGLARVDQDGEGDTLYAIDRVGEERLVDLFTEHVACIAPILLLAEGLPPGGVVLPRGAGESEAVWRVLVDPIDGTRGLMYQKRSAWILTGVAPNRGAATSLADIVLAAQTEVPLVKQHLCDRLWAMAGCGTHAERYQRIDKSLRPLALKPSSASTIAHGFSTISRFFPGVREELASIDDEIVRESLDRRCPARPNASRTSTSAAADSSTS